MGRIKGIAVLLIGTAFGSACSGTAVNVTNTGKSQNPANANRAASPSPDPVRTPAGFDATPSSSPPANAAAIRATPTSSIRPEKEKREISKNKEPKPASDIPSADEMQRMLGKPATIDEVNSPSMMKGAPMMKAKPPTMNPKSANVPMMKSNRKLGGKP